MRAMTEQQYIASSERSLLKAQSIESRSDYSLNLKARFLSEKLRAWSISQKSHAQQMKLFGYVKLFHHVKIKY
jgi:hypothetical protein